MSLDLLDADEIRNAIATLYGPADVFELRVLEGKDRRDGRAFQWAGWFTGDAAEALIDELRRLRGGWHGVYVTANPCDPLLLHRSPNRIEPAKRGATTTDLQIPRRRQLLADFDPVIWGSEGQIKGIAATDSERAAALERAELVAGELRRAGFPDPVRGDSGNGGHLLYRVDLPADSTLPERFARALARLWGDHPGKAGEWNRAATVEIDTSIYNPARIWKLYGTLACKGGGIGDRPWRMARLLEVPIGGADLLTAERLEAWLAAVEPVQEPAPAAAPARSPGPARGPAGDFDPLELARAAGLDLTDGRKRADGATFFEVRSACPGCDRERKAWLSVAESGAVGFGCRTQSCRYSDSKARPGDLWKAWRAEHDPAYAPDAAPGPTAEDRRASASAFAERHARPEPAEGGLDVSAFIGDAPIEPEPAQAPARASRRRQADDDGRHRVVVTVDPRELRDAVLEALAASPGVYVSQGHLATAAGGRMLELKGGALDSAAVDACRFVKPQRDRVTGEFTDRPDALPVRVRGMLENLEAIGPAALERFRVVDQVTTTPFFTADGQAVTRAGYCAEARTLLVDPPELEDQPEPDGAACLAYLRELVADFPFEGGLYSAEVSNWIGAALVPMVRPMIAGPVPMLLIEGNVPGIGKSFLASAIRLLYGLPSEAGALPKDEKMVATLIPSILKESKAVHVFDDVTHSVISATLNRLLTCRTYSDRVLGVSETASYIVLQLWIMTMNNARVSADMVRRVFRTRLRFEGPGKPEDRRFARDFLAHVEANRAAILARLRQLVAEWIAAGRPVPAGLPTMGSFEAFARVVGSILWHAGDRAWLTNAAATKEAVALDDDWPPFLAAWHTSPEMAWNTPQRPAQLWAFAAKHGLLGSVLGQGGNDSAQIERLRYQLRARRDTPINGYRIVERADSLGQRVYNVEIIPQQATLGLH